LNLLLRLYFRDLRPQHRIITCTPNWYHGFGQGLKITLNFYFLSSEQGQSESKVAIYSTVTMNNKEACKKMKRGRTNIHTCQNFAP
jgi:hypothetical protein